MEAEQEKLHNVVDLVGCVAKKSKSGHARRLFYVIEWEEPFPNGNKFSLEPWKNIRDSNPLTAAALKHWKRLVGPFKQWHEKLPPELRHPPQPAVEAYRRAAMQRYQSEFLLQERVRNMEEEISKLKKRLEVAEQENQRKRRPRRIDKARKKGLEQKESRAEPKPKRKRRPKILIYDPDTMGGGITYSPATPCTPSILVTPALQPPPPPPPPPSSDRVVRRVTISGIGDDLCMS